MLQNPITLVRRFPGVVQILIFGMLVNKLGSFILPYLTLVLSREFHMSGGEAGVLVMSYGFGSLISVISGGILTDTLGRRHTLLLSLFGSGSLAIAMAFAQSSKILIPILLLFGFIADLYRPACSAIISDLLPSHSRATGFAALRMVINLGFAAGLAIGGFLVEWSWRILFAADGLTTIIFGFIVLAGIPETRPEISEAAPRASGQASPWKDRVFLRMIFSSLSYAFVIFSFFTILPLTITHSAGYPASVYGALVSVNGLIIALFELSIIVWLRRFRRLRVAAFGYLITGIGFGLMGFAMHWSWFLVTVILWTVGEFLTVPQQMSFVADWSPPEARGRYLGFFSATWSLGMIINSIVLLPLHARLPESLFWPLLLLFVIPAAFVLLGLNRTADLPEFLRGQCDDLPSPEAATQEH